MSSVVLPNAPGVYTNVEPPPFQIVGTPTNIIGYVGTASWGPVNSPVNIGGMKQQISVFGPMLNALMDLGTSVFISILQKASQFVCVRVTDGTDTKATVDLMDTATPTPAEGALLTALYSGAVGNTITAAITSGSVTGTFTLTITRAGFTPEVFTNISGTGSAFWQNLVNAVNSGTISRGPSQLVVASLPTTLSVSPPNDTTIYSLIGGTNGNSTVTATTLVGTPASPRSGMYALSGTEASIVVLCDNYTATTFPAIEAFCIANNMYGFVSGTSGQTANNVTANVTFFSATGVASHQIKFLAGDWCFFSDPYNNIPMRMVTPLAFAAAREATLGPEQSGLNKQIVGIIATQSTLANQRYDKSDMATYRTAGIDAIVKPISRGKVFGLGNGINSSSNPAIIDDSYTRMTNFLATTFNLAGGQFEGGVQTPSFWADEEAAVSDFLSQLRTPAAPPAVISDYSVTADATNNTPTEVTEGLNNIYVQVQYFGIAVKVIFTLQAGSNVVISHAA